MISIYSTSDTPSKLRHFSHIFVITLFLCPVLFAQNGGSALSFDSDDGYVEILDSDDLGGGSGRSKTVEVWINLTNLAKDRPVIQKWLDKRWKDWGLLIDGSGQNEVSVAIENDGSNFEYKAGGGVISPKRWHHIAMTYDGATDTVRIFIDGIEHGTGELVTNGGMPNTNANILVGGKHPNTPDKKFSGQMDEVRIWEHAKSASELRDNMNQTLLGTETGLVAYWKFDLIDGLVVDDLTANNHDGTLVGESTTSPEVTEPPKYVASSAPIFAGNFVFVASPNGGETLEPGTQRTISWTSEGAGPAVRIEYSTDAGLTWVDVISTTENDGEFDWTVPQDSTHDAVIRVTDIANGSLTDLSDNVFSVIDPAVIAPPPPVDEGSCLVVDNGYRDFFYGLGDVAQKPTENKPESKLWFNAGSWWGVLWDRQTLRYRIYKLDNASQCWLNTGIDVDERPQSAQDVLWDGSKLYVASRSTLDNTAALGPNEGKIFRFSYDAATETYSLDAGFPVAFMTEKVEALVLTKDSTGQLWTTWTKNSQVWVNRSLGDDLTWGQPFVLPVMGGDLDPDDISTIVAFGGNKVGVMWSNQVDFKGYFAVHEDGKSDLEWETRETALSSASANVMDDHMSLAVRQSTGEVVAAIKTNFSGTNETLIYFLKRSPAGSWSKHEVSIGADNVTRPMVLVDSETDSAYVFLSRFTAPRRIELKTTHLDNISFQAGEGRPFIYSQSDNDINNAKSTKQTVNSTTGVVVIASDHETRYYLHNLIGNGGGGGTNIAPIAMSDSAATTEDVPVQIDITANDTDPDGIIDKTTVAIVAQPASGAVAVDASGLATYTPSAGFIGGDSFDYTVSDNLGAASNTATVAVTVAAGGSNLPPIANDDVASTTEGSPVNINVTANDSDPDGTVDVTSVNIVTQPANGTVGVNVSGVVTYTPNAGFSGQDSFGYQVADNAGAASNTATVTVTVSSGGGGSTTLVFDATDDAQVKAGSPNENFDHKNTAKVQRNSFNAYYKFDVTGLAAPVLSAKLRLYVTDSSDDGGTVHKVSNDFQGTSQAWTEELLTWNNAPSIDGVALDNLGAVTVDTYVEFDVTAAISADGPCSFAIKNNSSDFAQYNVSEGSHPPELIIVTDGGGGTTNQAPIANADNATTGEGVPVQVDVLSNDSDSDGFLVPSTLLVTSQPTSGSVAVSSSTGAVTYTPNPGFSGADSFSYTVEDDDSAVSNQASVSLTVTASGGGGGTLTFQPTDDNQTKITAPSKNYGSKGTSKVERGTFNSHYRFTVSGLTGPIQSAIVRLQVTDAASDGGDNGGSIYVASNNHTGTSTAWAELTLTAGNGPDITGSSLSTVGAVTPLQIVDFDVTAAVTGNGTFSFCITGNSDNQVKYFTKEGSGNAPQLIVVEGTGGGGNVSPLAVDDSGTTLAGLGLAVDVLANDSDPDGTLDATTVALGTSPANGNAVVNPTTGVISYTPTSGFIGTDTFTYTVRDNEGAQSNAATVTINVLSDNDPPVAVDDSESTLENTAVLVPVLSNDSDSDGTLAPASVTIGNTAQNGGTTIDPGTGSITYTPNNGFTGSDSFTYTVDDNEGASSNEATVSITVTPQGGGGVLTFQAEHDGQVKLTEPGNNYGSKSTAKIDAGKFNSYFKFQVSGVTGNITQARIQLRVTDNSRDGSDDGGSFFSVSNNFAGTSSPWVESGLTAGNAPAIEGTALSSVGTVAINEEVEWDVTSAVNGNGTFSFALRNTSGNQAKYYTQEGAFGPQLIVSFGSGGGGNVPPVAQNDAGSTPENVNLVINILANDNDPDGALDATTVTVKSLPQNGSVQVNPTSGITTYTPVTGFQGADTFTYTVDDNEGATSNEATVSINVGSGGSTTLSFLSIEDAQVKVTEPARNYATKSTAKVEKNKFNAFFKFAVTGIGGTVQSARLRFFCTNGSDNGGSVHLVSNDFQGTTTAWVEGSLTAGNAPAIDSPASGQLGAVGLNTFVEVDITPALTGNGTFSFALQGQSNNQAAYHTKDGANAPELLVETGGSSASAFELALELADDASLKLDNTPELPQAFELNSNYPNPFNAETQIRYALPQAANVSLVIYNLIGQEVKTLVQSKQEAGFKVVAWNGRNASGTEVGSGVYFVRLKAAGRNFVQRVTLQK